MDIFYTWKDVEVELLLKRSKWPESWINIDVFSNELNVYINNKDKLSIKSSKEFLREVFKNNYIEDSDIIQLKLTNSKIEVFFEYDDISSKKNNPYPLFKDYMYVDDSTNVEDEIQELKGSKVVAFHSYKGGVGRTLSLISLAKEIIEEYNANKKVLIIDSDIEAPGLTWLANQENYSSQISYLDILSIIHAKGYDEEVISNIATVVERSTLEFNTNKIIGNHYFIPTYRYKEQLFDIYSKPENILMSDSNKYVIVDFLSKLGKELDVDMVLIDLRAGVSEYSAPFLFDPRVTKYLVSSTSYQSAYGTNLILNQINKQKYSNNVNTQVILTMVPSDFSREAREKVYNLLMEVNDKDVLQNEDEETLALSDYIIEVPASDSLIHLGNLRHICNQLKHADSVSREMKKIAQMLCEKKALKSKTIDRDEFLKKLNELTESEITAEGNGVDTSKILNTKALESMAVDFRTEIPKLVVLGVKGSGKTYIYKQMLFAKTWANFISNLGKKSRLKNNALIFPLISSSNKQKFTSLIQECIKNCHEEIPFVVDEKSFSTKIINEIKEKKEKNLSESNWINVWKEIIIKVFKSKLESLEKIDSYLQEQNKQIVFIVDGLEDIFKDYIDNKSEKNAISTLCIDIVNILNELPYGNIGIVNFMRRDIAELAIQTNYEQFKNQYYRYQLEWSQTDALRLALWLANNVSKDNGWDFYTNSEVPIENASREVIEEALYKLWGKKMGSDTSKTAFTSRWVLASLSDFKGQLQARDIVRFLNQASKSNQKEEVKQYKDRYLTPNKMKDAIKSCSSKKLGEIKMEIKQLEPIFDKLQNFKKEDKVVPLKQEVLNELTTDDKITLERYGYFIESDGEYYIPESIRFALDYNKTRRGGIKVVSLLVQK